MKFVISSRAWVCPWVGFELYGSLAARFERAGRFRTRIGYGLMRHRWHGRKLGRTSKHRDAMTRNMVTSLIDEERVRTTLAKAKEVRRHAERIITTGKKGNAPCAAAGRLLSQDARCGRQAHGDHRPEICGAARRLYPDSAPPSPAGRRRAHGAPRADRQGHHQRRRKAGAPPEEKRGARGSVEALI